MCTLSQTDPLLEGLCESPHDLPPRWAALLTAYLDESIEQDNGFVVIAGFLGKKSQWVKCARRWRKALGKHEPLHMKKLQGWEKERNKELLERLGKVPDSCGLTLVYCSLRVSDYHDLMVDTIAELGNAGYLTAMRCLVINILQALPLGQRLEVISESLPAFAGRREFMLRTLANMPAYQDRHGNPLLAKWSSAAKSTLFEPADYAAYALMQRLRDETSRKAMLCAPILAARTYIGGHIERDIVRKLIGGVLEHSEGSTAMGKEDQRKLNRVLGEITGTRTTDSSAI